MGPTVVVQRDHSFTDYNGRRVLVLGLGLFGGGAGAVRFLARRGARVTIADARTEAALAESRELLTDVPVERCWLGRQDVGLLDETAAELIVVNPAIRRDHPLVQAALERRLPVTSEMNLFWQHCRAIKLAVTGSNGKSTTTALLHNILARALECGWKPSACDAVSAENDAVFAEGDAVFPEKPVTTRAGSDSRPPRCWLGGNLGRSLLPLVDEIAPQDVVVLELSSFQLTDLDRLGVSPHVGVVTNFAPNHLDWHPSLDHYRWAKQTLWRHMRSTDVAVFNADDLDVRTWPRPGQSLAFGLHPHGSVGAEVADSGAIVFRDAEGRTRSLPLRDWLTLPGDHNLANALGATVAALAVGVSDAAVEAGLRTYQPLPHRLQPVGRGAGRVFYNDSLATTPESTMMALNALTQPIVLLAGGYDKRVDLTALATAIARRCKAVSVMGQVGPDFARLIASQPGCQALVSPPQSSLAEAFRWALEASTEGDAIVLSPACASYDWFRNFADRGEQFTRLVAEWLAVH